MDKYDPYSELMLGIFLTVRKFWRTFIENAGSCC